MSGGEMIRRVSVLFLTFLIPTSCDSGYVASGPAPIALEAETLSAKEAAEIFHFACIDQSPRFQGTASAARSLGFQTSEDGKYVDTDRNIEISVSHRNFGGDDKVLSTCAITFLVNQSERDYVRAVLDIPRVTESEKPRGLIVDGNGQKPVSFLRVGGYLGTDLRRIELKIGSSAEYYDELIATRDE